MLAQTLSYSELCYGEVTLGWHGSDIRPSLSRAPCLSLGLQCLPFLALCTAFLLGPWASPSVSEGAGKDGTRKHYFGEASRWSAGDLWR